MIDFEKVKKVYPNAKPGIIDELKKELDLKDWSDENKIHFIAQCAHESSNFRVVVENLNYSITGLMTIFPKYFKFGHRDPYEYQRKPEKIANLVYANRLGNSDVKSGDGWRYRGRGLIQITGKDNYIRCLKSLGMTDPNYLETIEGSVKSAIWFWEDKKLTKINDIKILTKMINGGFNGLNDRQTQYNNIKKILNS